MASDSPHDPPFRADHVGSLLRPPELLKARGDRAAGKISAEDLRAVEDSSIRDAVAFQESVGLQSITDGEYRREIFYSDFYFRGLGGGTVAYDPSSIDEVYFIDREGHKLPLLVPHVQARMRWHAPIHVDDFKFLRAATSRTPKITIPSPTIIHFRAGRQNISTDAYPDIDLIEQGVSHEVVATLCAPVTLIVAAANMHRQLQRRRAARKRAVHHLRISVEQQRARVVATLAQWLPDSRVA